MLCGKPRSQPLGILHMHIRDLIDKARDETGSNYTEIATRLGRSKQLISNWRSGAKVPEDGDILTLARMARERPEPWLATAQAARTTGEARSRWEAIAKQLGAAAVVVLAVALPMVDGVEAKACNIKGLQAVYYVKFRRWIAEKLAQIQQLAMSSCFPVAHFHRNITTCTT